MELKSLFEVIEISFSYSFHVFADAEMRAKISTILRWLLKRRLQRAAAQVLKKRSLTKLSKSKNVFSLFVPWRQGPQAKISENFFSQSRGVWPPFLWETR